MSLMSAIRAYFSLKLACLSPLLAHMSLRVADLNHKLVHLSLKLAHMSLMYAHIHDPQVYPFELLVIPFMPSRHL